MLLQSVWTCYEFGIPIRSIAKKSNVKEKKLLVLETQITNPRYAQLGRESLLVSSVHV